MQKPNANGVEYTGNTLADEFEDEIWVANTNKSRSYAKAELTMGYSASS